MCIKETVYADVCMTFCINYHIYAYTVHFTKSAGKIEWQSKLILLTVIIVELVVYLNYYLADIFLLYFLYSNPSLHPQYNNHLIFYK